MATADRTTTRDMILLLTAYLSYRALRGRRDLLDERLRDDEVRRLTELERVFGIEDTHGADRPTFMLRLEGRTKVRLPVEFRGEAGEPSEGMLGNVSRGGFFVETAQPGRPGEVLVFKFLDLAAGRAWQFSGEVQWAHTGAGGGMGMRFVGIPLEVRLAHISTLVGRLPIAA